MSSLVRYLLSSTEICFGSCYTYIAMLLTVFAVWSDARKIRFPFIFASQIISAIGFGINLADLPIGVKYFGTFFIVAGSYSGFPGAVAWSVLSPHYYLSRFLWAGNIL